MLARSVADHADSYIGEGGDVAVWPYSGHGDPEVETLADHPRVGDVYVANGTGDTDDTEHLKRVHEEDDRFTVLDYVAEQPVLSHDLATLVEQDVIGPVSVEYARDPAMTVAHDPDIGVSATLGEMPDDAYHDRFTDILQENAETSARMVADDGVAVYGTRNFGSWFQDPVTEECGGEHPYEEALAEALAGEFDRVEAVELSGGHPQMEGQRYVAASN